MGSVFFVISVEKRELFARGYHLMRSHSSRLPPGPIFVLFTFLDIQMLRMSLINFFATKASENIYELHHSCWLWVFSIRFESSWWQKYSNIILCDFLIREFNQIVPFSKELWSRSNSSFDVSFLFGAAVNKWRSQTSFREREKLWEMLSIEMTRKITILGGVHKSGSLMLI